MKEQLTAMEGRLTGTNIQLIGILEEKNRRNERKVMSTEITSEVFQY